MATYFLVGSSGAWQGGTIWATSSGGTATAQTPTTSDDIVFDLHSTGTVTVGTNSNAHNITMTAPGAATITMGATAVLNIAGNLSAAAGITWAPNVASTINFISTSIGQTITSAGYRLGNININGVGGVYQLQDALNPVNGTTVGITLVNGTFDTNGKAVGATSGVTFNSSNSNTRSLILGATTFSLTPPTGQTALWDTTITTGMTLSAASSTLNVIATTAAYTFSGGGLSYGTLTATALTAGGSLTLIGNNTFGTLTVSCTGGSGTPSSGFFLADDQTVTGTFTSNGASPALNANNRRIIQSSVVGTPRTITANAVSFTYMDFRDITGAGAANWNLASITGGSGDCGGNSGIIFTTPKNCYIKPVSGSQTYVSVVFVTISGGSSQIPSIIPLPQDTLFVDGNAFNGATTFTLGGPRLSAIDFTGVTNTPAIVTSLANEDICGSLKLVAGMTHTGTGTLNLTGRGAQTIDGGGLTWPAGILNINTAPTSTYSLSTNFTSSGGLTNTSGIFSVGSLSGTFAAINLNGGTLSGTGTLNGTTYSQTGGLNTLTNLALSSTFAQSGGTYNVPALGTITWGTGSTWTWTPNTFVFTTGGIPTWTGSSLVVAAAIIPGGNGGGSWLSC